MMKISVITVVFNNVLHIEDCIKSVIGQAYKNIEYIVIDGGSTDGTLDIIKKYRDNISKWISEPDGGIYDAMNKGIEMATGDIVGFLNSDDIYADERVIEDIADVFVKYNTDSCYGDLVYVDKDDLSKVVRYWKSEKYEEKAFKRGWHPPHPTFFVKKSVYSGYGGFNPKYKIGADYGLMLRFLVKYGISTHYISRVFVKMRIGGSSNRNVLNVIKANVECYRAWKECKLNISLFIILRKPLSKLIQFIAFPKP